MAPWRSLVLGVGREFHQKPLNKLLCAGLALLVIGGLLWWLLPETFTPLVAVLGGILSLLGLRDGGREKREYESREQPRLEERERLSKEAEIHRKQADKAEAEAKALEDLRVENRKNLEEASQKRRDSYEKFQEKRKTLAERRGTTILLSDAELRDRIDKLRSKLHDTSTPRKTNR